MRKFICLLIASFCLTSLSNAQDSIGFSDPDNIQPLLEYRLPDWGFSNFYLDFSVDGNHNRSSFDATQNTSSDHEFSASISPVFLRYAESEARISSFRVQSQLNYYADKSSSFQNTDRTDRDYSVNLSLNASEKFYLEESDFFLSGYGYGNLRQDYDQYRMESNNLIQMDESSFNRFFTSELSIGFGYGRMRNVNPMIRSLRLNERMQALGNNQSMSNSDYLAAAQHFTKHSGYAQRYDRPEKHFWEDMNTVISPDLSSLSPFDLLYLTETSLETIGSRSEGWEVEASGTIRYTTDYSRTTDNLIGQPVSNLNSSTMFIPRLEGRWSKNVSLKNQFSLHAYIQSFIELDDNSDNYSMASVGASWLHNVTDRILSTTSFYLMKPFGNVFPSGLLNINSTIDYFIENRFSLFTNVNLINRPEFLSSNQEGGSTQIIYRAGLRYHFLRGLF